VRECMFHVHYHFKCLGHVNVQILAGQTYTSVLLYILFLDEKAYMCECSSLPQILQFSPSSIRTTHSSHRVHVAVLRPKFYPISVCSTTCLVEVQQLQHGHGLKRSAPSMTLGTVQGLQVVVGGMLVRFRKEQRCQRFRELRTGLLSRG